MMQFTKDDLLNLQRLSRISIAPENEEKMLHDMQAILGYISEINNVAGEVERREVTAKAGGHYNIMRDDVAVSTTSPADIIAQAPATHEGYVQVAQVLK
jgi:aspartyl/glutamyl-tRNA(Asn/Gln) amidotransferase C subunit